MHTIYYLSSCSTCKRILKEIGSLTQWELIDIKKDPLDEQTLERIHAKSGSYEALINKRAQKFKDPDLVGKTFSEQDYKNLLLSHYTFLKRPLFIIKEELLAGNSKEVIEKVKSKL